ncbi:MAG TPA: Hsp20/alpha crystallin family protein [bacterium]
MTQPKPCPAEEADWASPIEEELDFFFSSFFGSSYPSLYRKELTWKPSTDFYETETHFVLVMELAQIRPEEVSIQLQDGMLTVRGIRKAVPPLERRRYHKMEINYGPFEQRLSVPSEIDMTRLSAAYQNGFLEIRLPKKPSNPSGTLEG